MARPKMAAAAMSATKTAMIPNSGHKPSANSAPNAPSRAPACTALVLALSRVRLMPQVTVCF